MVGYALAVPLAVLVLAVLIWTLWNPGALPPDFRPLPRNRAWTLGWPSLVYDALKEGRYSTAVLGAYARLAADVRDRYGLTPERARSRRARRRFAQDPDAIARLDALQLLARAYRWASFAENEPPSGPVARWLIARRRTLARRALAEVLEPAGRDASESLGASLPDPGSTTG